MEYDVFISYASEDEESFVSSLAQSLGDLRVKVWFAPAILKVGDSLSRSIDKGLANSKFGVVVLSKAFISKPWPEYELRGLTSKAIGADNVILPIWHNITREEVLHFSPPLADTYALDTSSLSLNEVALKITEKVRPDIFNNLLRFLMFEEMRSKSESITVPIEIVKKAPIRHKNLSEDFLIRAKIIQYVFFDVLPISLEETIDSFQRDLYPSEELTRWERLAAAYLDATYDKGLSREKRRDILSTLLGWSSDMINEENAHKFQHLNYQEVVEIGNIYLAATPRVPNVGMDDAQ